MFTALTDLKGGWLLQPDTHGKPNKDTQLDIHMNYVDSTNSMQTRKNFVQGLDFAKGLFVRATYFF